MIRLSILFQNQHSQHSVDSSQIEVGNCVERQKKSEHPFFHVEDPFFAENQMTLRFDSTDKLTLFNRGAAVVLESGRRIYRGHQVELDMPTRIQLGETTIEIQGPTNELKIDRALTSFEQATGFTADTDPQVSHMRAPSTAKLNLWFEAISNLQKNAAGTQAFFLEAAKTAFDPGGLDCAMVLSKYQGKWAVEASFVPSPELGISFRNDIVEMVASSGKTFFHDSEKIANLSNEMATEGQMPEGKGLADGDSIACAPVHDAAGNVCNILYALRSTHRSNHRVGIRSIEARFIQVIAESISAALIRFEMEAEKVHDRALLEQAFSPSVASVLQRDPKILEGREQEVTVMFADIRGFTSIAERVSTRVTYQFLADVMDRLTEIIMGTGGVVIDYIGDGIAAFWNAPIALPGHPSLACDAAFKILDEVPNISQSWQGRLGSTISIGIGINSGIAQVGNSGSRRRLKYGPRGNVVNIAQRIESATKTVCLPLLVSVDTAFSLNDRYESRRIYTTQVPGIQTPLDLYQPIMKERTSEEYRLAMADYEHALVAFEKQDLSTALHELVRLETRLNGDQATEFLLKQIKSLQGGRNDGQGPRHYYPLFEK